MHTIQFVLYLFVRKGRKGSAQLLSLPNTTRPSNHLRGIEHHGNLWVVVKVHTLGVGGRRDRTQNTVTLVHCEYSGGWDDDEGLRLIQSSYTPLKIVAKFAHCVHRPVITANRAQLSNRREEMLRFMDRLSQPLL